MTVAILERLSGHPTLKAPEQLPSGLTGGDAVLIGVLVLVLAPVAEETFFRGFLFRAIRERHGFWYAGATSAVVFGLVHWSPDSSGLSNLVLVIPLAFVGLGLAYVYERRRNLLVNIAAHATFNAVGFLYYLKVL